MTVLWYPLALDDLESIQAYIARDSPRSAAAVTRRIVVTTDRLAAHPRLGRPGQVRDTRELVIPRTPYIAIYRVQGEVVEILRVVHGARRWPSF